MRTHEFARAIDLDNATQVSQWCDRLHCTENVLREAVGMVGPDYVLVEQWVRWRGLR